MLDSSSLESSRFDWVRRNQKEIRTDKYSGILDAIAQNDLQNAGQCSWQALQAGTLALLLGEDEVAWVADALGLTTL